MPLRDCSMPGMPGSVLCTPSSCQRNPPAHTILLCPCCAISPCLARSCPAELRPGQAGAPACHARRRCRCHLWSAGVIQHHWWVTAALLLPCPTTHPAGRRPLYQDPPLAASFPFGSTCAGRSNAAPARCRQPRPERPPAAPGQHPTHRPAPYRRQSRPSGLQGQSLIRPHAATTAGHQVGAMCEVLVAGSLWVGRAQVQLCSVSGVGGWAACGVGGRSCVGCYGHDGGDQYMQASAHSA